MKKIALFALLAINCKAADNAIQNSTDVTIYYNRQLRQLNLSKNEYNIDSNNIKLENFNQFTVNGTSILELPISSLILQNCELKEIPNFILHYARTLTFLDLSNNQIKIAPHFLKELTNLKVLDLTNNKLKYLSQEIFNSKSELRKLYLSNNDLEILPDSITELQNLNNLNISNNNLKQLPERIFALKKLTILNASYNQLITIPNEIKSSNITALWLDHNDLEFIPESISNFKDIEDLKLSYNSLKVLPDTITYMIKLKILWLSHNELEKLPDLIGSLNNIEFIHLESNQLERLPNSICKLIKITFLNLSNNNLKLLPENLGELTNLTKLNLMNNRLSLLPESIGNLSKLTYLNLCNNNLIEFPIAITKLNLSYLNIFAPNGSNIFNTGIKHIVFGKDTKGKLMSKWVVTNAIQMDKETRKKINLLLNRLALSNNLVLNILSHKLDQDTLSHLALYLQSNKHTVKNIYEVIASNLNIESNKLDKNTLALIALHLQEHKTAEQIYEIISKK